MWGWLGVFIAPTTKHDRWWRLSVRWRTGQSGAHRTCPVPQPRHQCCWIPTIGVLTSGPALMSGGAPDMNCSLSGAPAWACLPSARFWRALNAPAGDRWCDRTSQVIRPTCSCPCPTDIRHPVDVPKSLDKFGIFPYLTRNVSPVLQTLQNIGDEEMRKRIT
jgi:hypothetical protein